jgi:hypothetical protein
MRLGSGEKFDKTQPIIWDLKFKQLCLYIFKSHEWNKFGDGAVYLSAILFHLEKCKIFKEYTEI